MHCCAQCCFSFWRTCVRELVSIIQSAREYVKWYDNIVKWLIFHKCFIPRLEWPKKCVFRHVRNNLNVTYVNSMFFGTCRSQATETVTGAERWYYIRHRGRCLQSWTSIWLLIPRKDHMCWNPGLELYKRLRTSVLLAVCRLLSTAQRAYYEHCVPTVLTGTESHL